MATALCQRCTAISLVAATDLFRVAADLGLLRGERVGEAGVGVERRVGLLGNTALLGRGRGCSAARPGVLGGVLTEGEGQVMTPGPDTAREERERERESSLPAGGLVGRWGWSDSVGVGGAGRSKEGDLGGILCQ